MFSKLSKHVEHGQLGYIEEHPDLRLSRIFYICRVSFNFKNFETWACVNFHRFGKGNSNLAPRTLLIDLRALVC